jgi:hypothetical protein
MSEIVPSDQIEQIVGAQRHRSVHLGRAVSSEQTVYILHSVECRASGIDLRECKFSIALDNDIDLTVWAAYLDRPVLLMIWDGFLVPKIIGTSESIGVTADVDIPIAKTGKPNPKTVKLRGE